MHVLGKFGCLLYPVFSCCSLSFYRYLASPIYLSTIFNVMFNNSFLPSSFANRALHVQAETYKAVPLPLAA